MELLKTGVEPPAEAILVGRQSVLVSAVGAAVFTMLFVGAPALMWLGGHLPTVIAIGVALMALLALPLFYEQVRSSLLRSNWVFAVDTDHVWLNLRSYRNHQLEPAETVARLSHDEIVEALEDTVRRSEETGDGTLTWKEASLCLQLRAQVVAPLKQAIERERKAKYERALLWGLVTVSGRSNHVPLRVSPSGQVRILWRSRYDFVRPGLRQVLAELAPLVAVESGRRESSEGDWRDLSEEQLDDRVLHLVEQGETVAALKLLRLRKGMSLTQAKIFLDELSGQGSLC